MWVVVHRRETMHRRLFSQRRAMRAEEGRKNTACWTGRGAGDAPTNGESGCGAVGDDAQTTESLRSSRR